MSEPAVSADGSVNTDPWHFTTFCRMDAGITEKIATICTKHSVHPDFITGWLAWFEAAHPDYFKKWWDAWMRINQLGEEGRTDAEAQKEFNAHLRIYRDGSLWCIERYVGFRKDQVAQERAALANSGKQEAMALR